ncbi:MAG: hypothetical protein A2747_01420 [Candidatus Yonathbacteria bacterium RIFCSPHIGHO2_01_FULL_44_41]|uniref:Uncharacterized protein n=1 Tax=Candidatus Yonathbacteria bacterium RIFCSPHIGHO2_02_FULL_44_14 TaxID=1802724 RepID=A0A1G2S767_9BACT|nr:MAG: hypothetical protein A2747_01420 [Candidatus Yonathbacteria bacterium RIFCSPHIGHO2_01_FULL_44_41]OHA80964.1 MAG: hypothetical protein A3D51_03000 [Candidatus Yonathbacteria bacterium RIFCSPHIGHO2_02_FULL_44_14]OHA82397.1 MAG: hypothetical protein A3B06_00640 [Candidatus Yonathbacteria bacterium RIFCSPLOWO2_01_FULL_43_20]
MKRAFIFLVVVYFLSAFGVLVFFLKNTGANATLTQELNATKTELASVKTTLDTEKTSREALEKKIVAARANALFLSLAFCPTLEATNKDAPCIKNSTEWLSQTIIAGTALTDTVAKTKMEALLIALGGKTKPTAKQLYEMLKPIEVESLRALTETLK